MNKQNKHIQFLPDFSGITVLFLPAFPLNHKMWQPQAEFLAKKGVRYFTPDYPGFGGRSVPDKNLTMSDYAEEVYREVVKSQIERAIVVGLSMGGYVALALFRSHPELFTGLLLANTRATADTEEGRRNRRTMIAQLEQDEDLTPVIESHLEKFFSEQTRRENPALLEQTRQMMRESSVEGVIRAQKAMAGRPDSLELLPQINFPVVVVAGKADQLTTTEDAQKMVERLPRVTLHVIPGAAHLSNLEFPEKFNQALWALIKDVL